MADPVVEAVGVGYAYGKGAPALTDVSLAVHPRRNVALVGESGAGKTTLLRLLLGLTRPTSGVIRHAGQPLTRGNLRDYRRAVQAVFQDPYSSLDPRQRIGRIVAEPLRGLVLGAEPARVTEAIEAVGLPADTAGRYPHEFSGGQRQRIAIARAMALEPRFVMLDEPTSALDRSVQAQIVDLLRDLQRRRNLSYLFISHDLKVVRALANRIVVMRDGVVVEEGPAEEIFARPRTDYTRALFAAAFGLEAAGADAVRE